MVPDRSAVHMSEGFAFGLVKDLLETLSPLLLQLLSGFLFVRLFLGQVCICFDVVAISDGFPKGTVDDEFGAVEEGLAASQVRK